MLPLHGPLGLRVLVPVAVALGAAAAAPVVMGAPQQPAGLGKALLATPGFQAGAERSTQRLQRRDTDDAKAQRRARAAGIAGRRVPRRWLPAS